MSINNLTKRLLYHEELIGRHMIDKCADRISPIGIWKAICLMKNDEILEEDVKYIYPDKCIYFGPYLIKFRYDYDNLIFFKYFDKYIFLKKQIKKVTTKRTKKELQKTTLCDDVIGIIMSYL